MTKLNSDFDGQLKIQKGILKSDKNGLSSGIFQTSFKEIPIITFTNMGGSPNVIAISKIVSVSQSKFFCQSVLLTDTGSISADPSATIYWIAVGK